MKQFLKYISLSLVFILGFTSCDVDESLDDTYRDLGVYAHLDTQRLSQFDTNSNLRIKFFVPPGVTAQSVEILRAGAVIGTGTVSGETATFNSSILGAITTGTHSIRIRTTFSNGQVTEQPFNITVVNSLSIPASNARSAPLSTLAATNIAFSTFNLGATIDNVALFLKKGRLGTYVDSGLTNPTSPVRLGTTNYQQLNLAVRDTLYYRVTVTSGTRTQSAENYIVVVPEP